MTLAKFRRVVIRLWQMAVQYYAVTGNTRTVDNPYRVFREINDEAASRYAVEVWEPETQDWRDNMEYAKYISREFGAEPITADQAKKLTTETPAT